MALTDVIDRLAAINEEQLVETQDIKVEMESLTDRVTELLELNKQDRLDRLEAMREGAGISAPSMTAGGVGGSGAGGGGGGLLGGLMNGLMGFFGLTGFLASLQLFSGKLLKLFKGVGRFLGPIGLIITGIIAAFATVEGFIKGYEEGGILGGLEGAVKGFFGAIVAAPLDLVREAAAWIAMQLGFAKVSTFLKSFSFAEIYDQLITSIFDGVERQFNGIKAIFTFDEDDNRFGALGNLMDIVFLPVNNAVNFVQGIFGWGDPDEPFRLSKFVSESIKSGMNQVLSVFGFEPVDTEQTLMGYLGDLFKSIFDTLMQTVENFGRTIKRDIDMTVTAFGFVFMNMFDELLLAIQKRVRIRLPELPGEDLKLGIGPIGITVPKGFVMAGQEFGVGDPNVTQERIQNRKIQMLDVVNQYEAEGGGLYSGYFQPIANNSGAAVQALNGMAGASGGGTTVYQTTNNITQGGPAGSQTTPNASSSTATASNDHAGTLDATQFISGGPAR